MVKRGTQATREAGMGRQENTEVRGKGERKGRGRVGNERRLYEVKKNMNEEDGTEEVRLCKER